ncbi:ABC transporter ATP-binding protein [Egibacter rhizosphaerae]|uniref:ABC transporter ATP-binding protein n=1 Tax=Egibacter rhizosphaerae TaxID=1670831 RepID=A0A411YF98_9ACTN|nr:ABC transporter ATP-binding protein [Egibacter rhizosphaerae]QBI19944.1 ABC transporter ATP-binding protein [Egibacter rhizosphaerae]
MTHLARGEPITVQDVSVSFGTARVVAEAGLFVPEGSFTGLIGPNGSGKTTLLRTTARLLAPDAGAVWIGDDVAERLSRRELAQRLAVVEQHAHTDVEVTAREVVLLGRTPHRRAWKEARGTDHEIAEHCLERVGLTGFADRSWHTLSGGERQRLQLARALAQEPTVLVLDEPTNHLDIAHALQLLALAQHAGVTTLAALHDLNLAATFCDALVLLDQGEVVAAGPPEEVLTPQRLAGVYGVEAVIDHHPATGRPAITFPPPVVSH